MVFQFGGVNLEMHALLAVAGALGGIVNALAGGATLITFPAMLAAGLPPVVANASNAVAISPGHLIAAFADRERLPPLDGRTLGLCLLACLGGAAGAVLLLVIPERYFVLPVPALIGLATVLFAVAPRIQARLSHRSAGKDRPAAGMAMIAAASIYGGFFGAGLGVMLTAMLSITEVGDLRAIKVMKNLLASAVSVAAIAIFCAQGTVRWPETMTMLIGAMAGGYAGGHLIRVLPAFWVRRIVIVAGVVMTGIYAWRYWF